MKLILTLVFALQLQGILAQEKQSLSTDVMDLVVVIPRLESGKPFDILKEKLNRIKSMKVEGYCNSTKKLCMRFHPEQYFNVLIAINEAGHAYYIKKNENVNEAINSCTEKKDLYIRESTMQE